MHNRALQVCFVNPVFSGWKTASGSNMELGGQNGALGLSGRKTDVKTEQAVQIGGN